MGKAKNRQNQGNQNQGNNSNKPEKKPGLFTRIRRWPSRHPKIVKGVKITAGVVGGTLAAVGGTGLVMAINDRREKSSGVPEMPSMPEIDIPAPVEYPTDD